MLAILWLLRARRRMTAARIAEALEISERSVYRYIDSLCASGVPIIADLGPDGGYRLAEGFQGAPLLFDPTELSALFHAAQFAQEAGHPHSEALDSATKKLRQSMSPEQIDYITRHTAAFRAVRMPRGGPVEPWLGALEHAVADSVSVRLSYHKPEQTQPSERLVDPYGVVHNAGLWYLVGYCHERMAVRRFRVDRIRELAPTTDHFDRPIDFQLDRHFSDDWIQERLQTGPLTDVLLTGEPWALAALTDHWFVRYCVFAHSPESLHLRVDPRGLARLPAILLPYGTAIRVHSPDGLREALLELVKAWAAHHGEKD